ncbi:alkbh6 [Symbiodinium sp. CCMP2456]|nr:alkbh6 [Symbiodinium sp. CCMP2456]
MSVFLLSEDGHRGDCMKWDPANDVPGGYQGNQSAQNTLFVEPRSLLIFSHDAFWHHRHGIDAAASEDIPSNCVNLEQAAAWGYKPGDRLERARRVSFTMRHLLPRCACQG